MMETLTQIREQVIQCTRCDLEETRINSVPGMGSFNSDVIFVGEAPGRSEDIRGEPFVGAAGKKLTEALEASGIKREEIYITNVVKCRPPRNRPPNCQERDSCADYLQREIHLVSPKIVCILGNTAFNSILGGNKITKHRGKIMRKDNQLYFITLHPAATIYRQELSKTLKSDIQKLFSIITELKNGRDIPVDVEYTS